MILAELILTRGNGCCLGAATMETILKAKLGSDKDRSQGSQEEKRERKEREERGEGKGGKITTHKIIIHDTETLFWANWTVRHMTCSCLRVRRETRQYDPNEAPSATFFCKRDYSRLRSCCLESRVGSADDVSLTFHSLFYSDTVGV